MKLEEKLIRVFSKIINKIPILFLPIHWISFLFPRKKNIWVFGSSFGKSFTGNPKYFYLYVNSKANNIRPIWISGEESIVSKLQDNGYEAYNRYSIKGLKYSLCAGMYIFDHYSKDICFWLSGGAIKVNLWHGIPLKKGHRDNKFDRVRNPRNIYDKIKWTFRRIQNEKPSHYYSVTCQYIKNIHTRAFNAIDERVFVCGYPRNDIFLKNKYLANKDEVIANSCEFYSDIKEAKNKGNNIIIYMPTFRESEDKFFEIINLDKINSFLKENNSILLVKAHHLSKLTKKFDQIQYSNIIGIKSTDDPYPFLNISDVLITDYSSVYFDFLLANKPIIFFPYDLDIYMNESRELYHDYDSVTPGIRVETMDELTKAIEHYIDGKDEFEVERQKVLDMMFDYNDGNSSERLYERLINLIK